MKLLKKILTLKFFVGKLQDSLMSDVIIKADLVIELVSTSYGYIIMICRIFDDDNRIST
jgi:hypothetical protein